ncbi:MAG: 50S ribosomal protein L21e [Sulfolobales archaeon]|nr:50S ribosomal protein L21e [Sulfolobales archaeon]MDW8083144.1 50S ribosomal protein L21e [Sulfolobales archaeon]
MVKASRGLRHRTRKLLRKNVRERGAIPPLSLVMQKYSIGDKVHIVPNPAIHEALPHRRYVGKTGTIVGERGRAYLVEIAIGSKRKIIITVPEHLRPAQIGN